MTRHWTMVSLALAWLAVAAAQQTPPRDTPARATTAPAGTSQISGIVVSADADGKPLRLASVTLVSGSIQFPYVTVTDDDGVFQFDKLAAGSYALLASKPGYVSMFFGATTPGKGQGIPIAVGDNQRVTDVRVSLMHGSVITGVVRMQTGAPAVGASVRVLPVRSGGDTTRVNALPTDVQSILGSPADDRGRYRAYGLAPGRYVVEVRLDQFNPLSGQVNVTTQADVQWARQAPGAKPPVPQAPVTYAPVYAPSATNVAGAAVITLGQNEERDGVDVMMQFVPTATISGRVVYPDGSPVSGAQLSMRGADVGFVDIISAMFSGARTRTDGSFELRDVRPGTYTLSVRAHTREDAPPPSSSPFAGMSALGGLFGGSTAKPPTLWASIDLNPDGHDIDSVILQLQPGLVVSGKLAFDAASTPLPTDLSQYRVTLSPPRQTGSNMDLAMAMMTGTGVASGPVQKDGTFAVSGVIPGTYEVKVTGPGMRFNFARRDTGWVLKSAMLKQVDVADTFLAINPPHEFSGLAITLTDRPTELSGAMLDKSGRPAPGFPLVVFSADSTQWVAGSRRVQDMRPSTDGTFVLAGLPPGKYYVCALTDLDRSDLANPDFLKSLVPSSIPIELADGQHLVQNVVLQGR